MASIKVLAALVIIAAVACPVQCRVIEIGGHKGWQFNIYSQWVAPEIYMWDQLAFVNTQSFLEPADVWQMADEGALKNCNFTGATYIGNASTGNEVLTPPWLLSYATDFFFAAETNNGCQANQKIKITVLQGAAPPGTFQYAPAPAPAVAPVLPPGPAPAPIQIVESVPKNVGKKDPAPAPSSAVSSYRGQGCWMVLMVAALGLAAFL